MMTEEVVRRIVEDAVHAPSGDNAQPWRFSFSGETLRVRNVRGQDATLYNFRERGSYLAHGSLSENIALAAGHAGLRANITAFPGGIDETAAITFERVTAGTDVLYGAIRRRVTNRKPYRTDSLKKDVVEALHRAAPVSVSLRLVDDRSEIEKLADAVSVNERLLMENREIHDFLFGIILWNAKYEEQRPGLYIKTMEFPPPVQFLMRFVLKHWGAVRLLNRIGLSRAIPKQSSAVYRASGAFGAVVIEGKRDEDFFRAGRAVQRIWLAGTYAGLRMQPITAIPYLYQRVQEGETRSLSPEHTKLITDAHAVMSHAFDLKGTEHIAMLFRLGYGDEPTAVSKRLRPIFEA